MANITQLEEQKQLKKLCWFARRTCLKNFKLWDLEAENLVSVGDRLRALADRKL